MSKTWIASQGTAFALIPKGGSSSIKSTLYLHGPVQYHWNNEVDHCTDRVLFLREPIKRIQSAYKFFKNQHEHGCKHVGNKCPTGSYEQFIDHILQVSNPHWDSQVAQVTDDDGRFVPTHVYRFEDIGEVWQSHSDAPLNHKNSSPSYALDSGYRLEDVMEHCKDDFETWINITP